MRSYQSHWSPVKLYIDYIDRLPHCSVDLLMPWIQERNITRVLEGDAGILWEKVLRSGYYTASGQYWPPKPAYDPPYLDHGTLLKSKTGRVWLVYHPYHDADYVRPAVLAWAEKHGLKAEVQDASHSWYYPERTCMVTVWKEGTV